MSKQEREQRPTRGSVALAAKLAKKRGAQKELAERYGVSQPTVSLWASGHTKPGGSNMARLASEDGIPWPWWDEPAPEEASDDGGDAAA